MTRNPDLPCADCGKLMARGRGSLPAGRARCHPCRRVARGLLPTQKVNDFLVGRSALEAKRLPACSHCSGPIDPASRRWKYCSQQCLDTVRVKRGFSKVPKSTSSRGYGSLHQRKRSELLPLAYGTPCHLCGAIMQEGDDLHLDHSEDRTGYRGMAHASCNVRDGARRGAAAQRRKRLETGWRVGQDPGARRRPSRAVA